MMMGNWVTANRTGRSKNLVKQGYAVVSVDLSGQGETSSGQRDVNLTDWKTFYLAYLLGESIVGLRVDDVLAAADFVAYYQKNRDQPRPVHLVASGQSAIIALHAAALHPQLFASVTLTRMPANWSSVVRDSKPSGQLDSAIHGVLRTYDLTVLVELVGDEKVKIK